MTIKIADTFEVLTAAPIDSRMVIRKYDDLQYIDELVKYEGMVVYTLLEKSRYILKDGNFVLIDPVIYEDGENGYMLTQNAVTAISNTITTDNVPEGDTNLYFTSSNVGNTFIREQFTHAEDVYIPANGSMYFDIIVSTNFQVISIRASHRCRVRIYGDSDGRLNDLPRSFGTPPNPLDTVFVDFVVPVADTDYLIAPSPFVVSKSDLMSSECYMTITNNESTDEGIVVELTYVNFGLKTEQEPS